MIRPDEIKKTEAKHIIALVEQSTRAEILARLAPISFPKYGEWAMVKIDKDSELREYIFGTSNLIQLGIRWGLLKDKNKEDKWEGRQRGKSKKNKKRDTESRGKRKGSKKNHKRQSLI